MPLPFTMDFFRLVQPRPAAGDNLTFEVSGRLQPAEMCALLPATEQTLREPWRTMLD